MIRFDHDKVSWNAPDNYKDGHHAGLTTGLIFGVWLGGLATCLFALCWSFVR